MLPQPIECDVVLEDSDSVLLTVALPVVPRVGEELDLDLGDARSTNDGVYLVCAVRYHLRPRRLTVNGALFGTRVVVRRLG